MSGHTPGHKVRAHLVLIGDYDARRADEIVSLDRFVGPGGVLPYTAQWLASMTLHETDPRRQWGSAHHVTAILAERLSDHADEVAQLVEAARDTVRVEQVNGYRWSLTLHFGEGTEARDKMRAFSDTLASLAREAAQQEGNG